MNGIFSPYSSNRVWDATVSASVAPLTSYDLDALKSTNPAERVRWGATSVTVTFTLPTAKAATVFALPASNLQGAVLTLTNGAGLSEAVAIPTMPGNQIPLTAVLVFAESTSATWNLVISGNASNVTLGGGIWIGASEELDRNFRYGWREVEKQPGPEVMNDFGVEYVPYLGGQLREFACTFIPRDAELPQITRWFKDGRRRPMLWWPNPSVNDAYVGRWISDYVAERAHPKQNPVQAQFRELSKGKPV